MIVVYSFYKFKEHSLLFGVSFIDFSKIFLTLGGINFKFVAFNWCNVSFY